MHSCPNRVWHFLLPPTDLCLRRCAGRNPSMYTQDLMGNFSTWFAFVRRGRFAKSLSENYCSLMMQPQLVSHTSEGLQLLLNHFSSAYKCEEFGLTIDMKKTMVMVQGSEEDPASSIDNTILEATDSFTYLGSLPREATCHWIRRLIDGSPKLLQ